MKKYLMLLTCCVAIGIAMNVSLHFHANSNKAVFTLSNIEALANGEGTETECPYTGCVDCPHGNVKVLYVE